MLINELAARTGVSARALRHYEDRGVLAPDRDSNGYRIYSTADIARVVRIKTMIDAGFSIETIRRFLDCVRDGDRGMRLEVCPDLRAEIEAISARLDASQAVIEQTRARLCSITAQC